MRSFEFTKFIIVANDIGHALLCYYVTLAYPTNPSLATSSLASLSTLVLSVRPGAYSRKATEKGLLLSTLGLTYKTLGLEGRARDKI